MYKYKRRRCRYCGKWYTAKPPFYTKRIGGRQSLYCSDTCRKLWRKEYKHNWGQKNKERISKQKKEYYKEKNPNAFLIDYKRMAAMVQKVLNYELYTEQVLYMKFDISFRKYPEGVDEFKVKTQQDKIKSKHLDTEYLTTHESFDYSLINLRERQ